MEQKPVPTFRSQVLFFGFMQLVLKLRVFLTLPILSRAIGTEGFGTLSALLAYTGIAQTVVLFGIPTSLTVFIPWLDTKEKKSREFWAVAQVMLIASFVAAIIMVALSGYATGSLFKPGFNRVYYFLAIALVPLNVINSILYSQIVNNRQAKPYAGAASLATAAELVFLLATVWFWGLGAVLLSSIFGQVLTAAFMVALVMKENPFVWLRKSHFGAIKKYYVYSGSIVATSFAAWVIDSSDRLILNRYRPVSELGVYQVSYGLCMHTAVIAAPLFTTLMPFVATAVSEARYDSAREYLEKSFRALLMMFAPACVFFSMEAGDILATLSAPPFFSGAVIVPWVVTAIALQQIVCVYTYNLHAHKKGPLIILSSGVAAGLNVALNFAFVPKYGMLAAAVSTTAAYALNFALMGYISGRFLRVGISAAHVLKVVLSCAGLAGVIWLFSIVDMPAVARLAVTLAAGGACYVGLLLLTRAVSDDDRDRMFAFVAARLPGRGRG